MEKVEILAEGVVETADAAGVVRGIGRARAAGVFLRDTRLTTPDDAIAGAGGEDGRGRGRPARRPFTP